MLIFIGQLTAESSVQLDMLTLEKNFSDKVRSELESLVATVEARVHQATLSAMVILVVPRMELAFRSARISSAPNPDSVVLDFDQGDFSNDMNGLQMTASSSFKCKPKWNWWDSR